MGILIFFFINVARVYVTLTTTINFASVSVVLRTLTTTTSWKGVDATWGLVWHDWGAQGFCTKKEHLPAKLREAWAQNVQD